MLFWLTPIVYAIDDVPEVLRPIILSTPMSPFIATYQRLFIDRAWPEPAAVVLVAVYAVVMLAIGAVVFRSLEDDLGERL
jgi:ABC-type polysaccharide/polyol phosphate export permease